MMGTFFGDGFINFCCRDLTRISITFVEGSKKGNSHMDMDWKMVLANAVAGSIPVLVLAVAYWIREDANSRRGRKAEEDRKRMEVKIDGTAAMAATSLVSNGNMPEHAPCPPIVAKAIAERHSDEPVNAAEYVNTALAAARLEMVKQNIPAKTQELLVGKLQQMLEETRQKEERHNNRNAEQIIVLNKEIERLKAEKLFNPDETIKLGETLIPKK